MSKEKTAAGFAERLAPLTPRSILMRDFDDDPSDARLQRLFATGRAHIHSLDRCAHQIAGEEVHWMCGMYPVFTNAATARATDVDLERMLGDRVAVLALLIRSLTNGLVDDSAIEPYQLGEPQVSARVVLHGHIYRVSIEDMAADE